MNISGFTRKLSAVQWNIQNMNMCLNNIVRDNQSVLLHLVRDRMLSGRDDEGNVLAPNYLSDSYFKTREAAESYARMKKRLYPSHRMLMWNSVLLYPEKDELTPNLIVRGDFQDDIYITVNDGFFEIGSRYKESAAIEGKYNNKLFGIDEVSRDFFYKEYIKDRLKSWIYGV